MAAEEELQLQLPLFRQVHGTGFNVGSETLFESIAQLVADLSHRLTGKAK